MNLIIPDQSNPYASIVRNLSNTAWAFAKVQIKRRGECLHEYSVFRGYIYIWYLVLGCLKSPQSQSMIQSISNQIHMFLQKFRPEARDDVFHLQICAAYVGQDAGTRCRQHRRESHQQKVWILSQKLGKPAGMTGKPSWVETAWNKQFVLWCPVNQVQDLGRWRFTHWYFTGQTNKKNKQTNGQCIPGLGLRYAPHPWWSFDAGAAHDWKEPFPMRMSLAWLEFTVSLW